MKQTLESLAGDYGIYKARREEFEMESMIPFRVSPEPLKLTTEQTHELQITGHDVTDYIHASSTSINTAVS